jgi:K319-like protein/copper-binding protein NosD
MDSRSVRPCGPVAKRKALSVAPIACLLCVAVTVAGEGEAATLRVPADYPGIQQAINAAAVGDTVVVSPGTYYERIDFLGKDITVASEQGPEVTIIDGNGAGSVATFKLGETRNAVLSGFTLRNGYTNSFGGGGVAILSSSPTVRDNIITDNRVCSNGAGINSMYGSPLIEHNRITHNGVRGCSGGWGLGVYIYGNSAAEIVGNVITENNDDGRGAVSGGGIGLFAAGSATVRGNVISRNVISGSIGCGHGGAIAIANNLQGVIVDNVIVGNKACTAAAVEWIGFGSTGSTAFVNNTVTDNDGSFGAPAVYAWGVDGRNAIENNVITSRSGPALRCNNTVTMSPAVLVSNDIFRADLPSSSYDGTCPDQTGLNGNISADPLFLDPANGDYRVSMNSPVIDAGNDAAPQLPTVDFAGGSRVVDGNADGIDRVDIGALEYRNHAPVANAGEDRTLVAGPDCVAAVTLNGGGSDADGDALTYVWTSASGGGAGPTLSRTLPIGTHLFTLTVSDGNGGFASDTVAVTVVDAAAPTISAVSATPSVIPQTNHVMVPVTVSVSASDCDPAASCRIVSVASNEPTDGLGDGDTGPDWEITGDLSVNLRGERAGKGTGRVYTIEVACTDAAGNTATRTVMVTVPHD